MNTKICIRVHPDEKIPLCVDLAGGHANLKRQIVRRVQLDVPSWPLDHALLNLLRAEKNCGRKLILATATDKKNRGHPHDDPILFALRDKQSWLVGARRAAIGCCAGPK